jgi:hypothetical protein
MVCPVHRRFGNSLFYFSYILGLGSTKSWGLISLFGADCTNSIPFDLNSVRLTEILEYSLISASGKAQASPMPRFQAYKLWYAAYLADMGMISQASAYVSSISAVTKEFPQPCPYIHGIFGLLLKELGDRLEVMYGADLTEPIDSTSGGWLGKISENFTGAALGRGLEHLMNSAVGVPSSKPAVGSSAAAEKDVLHESHMKGFYGEDHFPHAHHHHIPSYTADKSHLKNDIHDSSFSQAIVEQSSYVDSSMNYSTQAYPNQSQSYAESSQYHQDQLYANTSESYGGEYYADQSQSHGYESGGYSNNSTNYHQYSQDSAQPQEPHTDINHVPKQKSELNFSSATTPKTQVTLLEDEDLGFGNSKKPPLPPSNSVEANAAKQDDKAQKAAATAKGTL